MEENQPPPLSDDDEDDDPRGQSRRKIEGLLSRLKNLRASSTKTTGNSAEDDGASASNNSISVETWGGGGNSSSTSSWRRNTNNEELKERKADVDFDWRQRSSSTQNSSSVNQRSSWASSSSSAPARSSSWSTMNSATTSRRGFGFGTETAPPQSQSRSNSNYNYNDVDARRGNSRGSPAFFRGSRGGSRGRGGGQSERFQSNRFRAEEPSFASPTKLKEWLNNMDSDQIIMELNKSEQEFEQFLERNHDSETLSLFIQILGSKLCGPGFCGLERLRNALISKIVNSKTFTSQLKELTMNLAANNSTTMEPAINLLSNLYQFYKFIADKMPNLCSDTLLPLISVSTLVIKGIETGSGDVETMEQLVTNYVGLKKSLDEFKTKRDKMVKSIGGKEQVYANKRAREFERAWMQAPPEDFRSLPIIPSHDELLSEQKPFLRPNITSGRYPTEEDYLDVQFRLLREDFVDPLRKGIEFYLSQRNAGHRRNVPGQAKIYYGVQLLPGLSFNTNSPSYTLKLELNKYLSRIKWDRSKRLLNGSLLLLTNDGCASIYFATVTRRDVDELRNAGAFAITWEGDKKPSFDSSKSSCYFDIVECDVFFETYRHTLQALKELKLESFPMAKYLIHGTSEATAPSYMQTVTEPMDFRPIMPKLDPIKNYPEDYGFGELLVTSSWPSAAQLGLDDSQYEAFQAALTKDISIIQGPPGTGKTFLGIQIAKFLLGNQKCFLPDLENFDSLAWRDEGLRIRIDGTDTKHIEANSPVLVVCYTNHALDQFLEAIQSAMEELGINPKTALVRVGGQTKSDAMKELSMFRLLEKEIHQQGNNSLSYYYIRNYRESFNKLRSIKNERLKFLDMLKSLNSLPDNNDTNGIVDLSRLTYDDCLNSYSIYDLTTDERELVTSLSVSVIRLGNEISTLVWSFFGLENKIYNRAEFNPYLRLTNIFNHNNDDIRFIMEQQQQQQSKSEEIVNNEQMNSEQIEEPIAATSAAQADHEENYDLDELLANRIEEIEHEVALDSTTTTSKATIPYLIGPRIFSKKFSELSIETKELEDLVINLHNCKDEYEYQYFEYQKQMKLRRAESERIKTQNIQTFLNMIIKRQKNNQLDLVPVTPELVKKVFERFSDLSSEFDSSTSSIVRSSSRVVVTKGSQPQRLPIKLNEAEIVENWSVYFHILAKIKTKILKHIIKLEDELIQASTEYKQMESYGYGLLLQRAKFVGMTTTGAAKYNSILQMMKSKLVIVEEAAEVLESHIVTSLTEHCQHLILIGDHLQLRPKTSVYYLGKDYNLDVSLFERMINNNMNLYSLQIQHRMRPEICELIVPTIYTTLYNHDSVSEYPNVTGVASNLYFINHNEAETDDSDSTSKSNQHEAWFLVKLCRHLILNGYSTNQITILTTYIGQMFLIKNIIGGDQDLGICKGVRVSVVDNYQGEENDIILLSLVRSNEDNAIGFLKTDNRVTVAISRAKHGLFVIGNMDSMTSSSPTWKKIVETLERNDRIGPQLNLKCVHHNEITAVSSGDDFCASPEGGCSQMCESVLDKCGHKCTLICHAQDSNHTEYKCRLPCLRECDKHGHNCKDECFVDPCPPCHFKLDVTLPCSHAVKLSCCVNVDRYECLERVTRILTCGHETRMFCFEDPTKWVCKQEVTKTLGCGHEQLGLCYEPIESIKCTTQVNVVVPDCKHEVLISCFESQLPDTQWTCVSACDVRVDPCGHSCVKKCHVNSDPNHDNYKCMKDCEEECPNKHKCMDGQQHKHKYYSKCPSCEIVVNTKLPCGHFKDLPCFESCDEEFLTKFECKEDCTRLVPDCDHPCSKKCSQPCTPCLVPVLKTSIDCPHQFMVPCHSPAQKKLCQEKVDTTVVSACGHSVQVPCSQQETITPEKCMKYCSAPCGAIFSIDKIGCEHTCTGTCSSCYQGRIHQKCTETCGRVLICGHICKSPCSAACPPCKEECNMKCEHSKCTKTCGQPCATCKERCTWTCAHKKCRNLCGDACTRDGCEIPFKILPCTQLLKCGHGCIGLNDEVCPSLCRICDKDETTEIFFGNEDKDNARFIMLEDCGHTLEVEGLDEWMKKKNDNGILVRRCPKCKTIITKSNRYEEILKDCYKDVMKVKTKIFGMDKKSMGRLEKLANKLENIQSQIKELYFFGSFISSFIYKNSTAHDLNTKSLRRFKEVDQYVLQSLTNMIDWYSEALTCLTTNKSNNVLTDEFKTNLTSRYVDLFNIIQSHGLPLNPFELQQFNLEFDRLIDLHQLYRRGSHPFASDPKVTVLYVGILGGIDNLEPYSAGVRAEYKLKLSAIDTVMKGRFTIEQNVARSVFSAISSEATSWYKCPCGSVYAVGNCGQFNQSSKCPDCKAVIGTGSTNNQQIADAHSAPSSTNFISKPEF